MASFVRGRLSPGRQFGKSSMPSGQAFSAGEKRPASSPPTQQSKKQATATSGEHQQHPPPAVSRHAAPTSPAVAFAGYPATPPSALRTFSTPAVHSASPTRPVSPVITVAASSLPPPPAGVPRPDRGAAPPRQAAPTYGLPQRPTGHKRAALPAPTPPARSAVKATSPLRQTANASPTTRHCPSPQPSPTRPAAGQWDARTMSRIQEDYAEFKKVRESEVKYLRERLESSDRQLLAMQQSFADKEKLLKNEVERTKSDLAFKDRECKELEEQLLVALTADDANRTSACEGDKTAATTTVAFADGHRCKVKVLSQQEKLVACKEEGKLRFHIAETRSQVVASASDSTATAAGKPASVSHSVASIRLELLQFILQLPDAAIVQAAAQGDLTLKELLIMLHQHATVTEEMDDALRDSHLSLRARCQELEEAVRVLNRSVLQHTSSSESSDEDEGEDFSRDEHQQQLAGTPEAVARDQQVSAAQPSESFDSAIRFEATATRQAMLLVDAAMQSLRRQRSVGFARSSSVQAILPTLVSSQ